LERNAGRARCVQESGTGRAATPDSEEKANVKMRTGLTLLALVWMVPSCRGEEPPPAARPERAPIARLREVDLGDFWRGEKPTFREGNNMLQKQAGYLGSAELEVSVRDKCVRRAGAIIFKSKPEAFAAVEFWRNNVANIIESGTQTDQRRNPWWFCAKSGQPLLIVVYDGMVVWASDIYFGTRYEKVEGELWQAVEKIHFSLVGEGVQDQMAPAAPEPAAGEADPFGEHLRALRAKVPEGFTVVVEPPFVVIGDEEPAMVRRRARETVRWAAERLKALYFEKDPNKILDIWLFKDDASYERHAREIFGDDPTTPFGYFSQTHGALIMNIRTGGGTLVHELVHPFVAANFPECPAWFNEGLGSLYEQSAERDGQIVGLTNWRLKGLQETIRAGKTPSFKALTATSDHRFYNEDKGTHYAQARYLCYWLQEKGLLAKFYREFRAGAKDDPTGYETLKRVLGEEDMDAFKKRWEAWVLGLRFP
jgi:hypothetical protein